MGEKEEEKEEEEGGDGLRLRGERGADKCNRPLAVEPLGASGQ